GAGDGQYDIGGDGTLVYAPGADGSKGNLVRLAPGHAPERLPVDSDAFLRFDLSNDRRWLAAVVQAAHDQELRVYDLRNGQRLSWTHAMIIRHALWTPAGDRLVVAVRDTARWAVLSGIPASGGHPDTVLSSHGLESTPDPVDVPEDGSAVFEDLG